MGCQHVESLLDVLNDAGTDPVKIFSIGPRNELRQLQESLWRVEPTISCVFSEHDMLEFLGPNVNKGTALSILCDAVRVSEEFVMAFGDNMNDLELLQVAGTGVSMSTAPDELRAIADMIACDVEGFLRTQFGEVLKLEGIHE
jgi:hydroxymethylpyrimidine pyrophosphatase-like HAD family hydrolase